MAKKLVVNGVIMDLFLLGKKEKEKRKRIYLFVGWCIWWVQMGMRVTSHIYPHGHCKTNWITNFKKEIVK